MSQDTEVRPDQWTLAPWVVAEEPRIGEILVSSSPNGYVLQWDPVYTAPPFVELRTSEVTFTFDYPLYTPSDMSRLVGLCTPIRDPITGNDNLSEDVSTEMGGQG